MSYPETIVFKDSTVSSTVLGIFAGILCLLCLRTYLSTGESLISLIVFASISLFLLTSSANATTSTLTPEGVAVKAWGSTVSNKWSNAEDLRIYHQTGYMGIGRRFVTFQDEAKQLQKHVFLVPISIFSDPVEVLEAVKSYREAAMSDKANFN